MEVLLYPGEDGRHEGTDIVISLPFTRLRREWPSHLTGALILAIATLIALEVLT